MCSQHYTNTTDPQTPPKASAGPSVTITLPQDTVSLDGGESADDFGIESYEWIRSGTSPAAGVRTPTTTCCLHTVLYYVCIRVNVHV